MANRLLIERNVMVAMRDGVKLATDIFRPDDGSAHPVLILRTPYDKSNARSSMAAVFNPVVGAERGYVVVLQDVRGRFLSEGRWVPFVNDRADGYDTVEWAAAQPWSNGSVGIYGASYMGVTALQAAAANPPHLKAAFSYLTGGNYHNGWAYSGGAFELGFNLSWVGGSLGWDTLNRLGLKDTLRRELAQSLDAILLDPWRVVRQLPLGDIPVFDSVAPYWRDWLNHPAYDDYWQAVDVVASAADIKVPLLQITGWYDNFQRCHMDLYEQLQQHPCGDIRRSHRLIIGPWDHWAYLSGRPGSAGERQFGASAVGGPPLTTNLLLQWFDHWLTGRDSALLDTPRVRYFAMGDNVWREVESWPPPNTPTRYYLHSGGHANSRFGDGVLGLDLSAVETPDSYNYDPDDPTPSVGGRTMHQMFGPGGIQDQARVEERDDVLVYTSPCLTKPLTIAGPVSVKLFTASSAPDTDFTAKLVDVEPSGYCANIAEGIIRARYRNGMTREELLQPGEVAAYTIDLWHTAQTFQAGHRLRLEISSSNFPRFDRNANSAVHPGVATLADLQVAAQQVFHDAERPSYLCLPIVA